MGYRFQHQLQVDNLPDPMLDNAWEVIMPEIDILKYLSDNGEEASVTGSLFTSSRYAPIVEQIVFAPAGFKNSQDIRAVTHFYGIPEDTEEAKEINITFYCDTSLMVQHYLYAWREQIFNREHEFYYMPHQYKKDIIVEMYGTLNKVASVRYILKGCYPILQDDFELTYTRTPKRMRITQKFNVDRVELDEQLLKHSIGVELLNAPQNLFANSSGRAVSGGHTLEGAVADNNLGLVRS